MTSAAVDRSRPGGSARWALIDATLIDPGSGSVSHGGVLIDAGRIEAVGPAVRRAELGDIPVVDATGRFVLPGLIDGHLHLAFDGGPRPIERFIEGGGESDLASRMARAAEAALRAGITTIRDLGGPNDLVFGLRDAIARAEVSGPRVVAAGLVLSPPAGHCHFIAHQTDGPGLAVAVTGQIEAGADCIKVMLTGGVHTPGSTSADVYYETADLAAAAEAAHQGGRRITGHATNASGIEQAVLSGFDSIQHGSALDERLAGLMVEHDVWLSPTLGTHAAMATHQGDPRIPAYVAAKAHEGSVGKAQAFQAALQVGVTIVAGTDGGVTFVGHDALVDELALLRAAGLDSLACLASATSHAAAEIGLADQIGHLAPDFLADLVVLDGDPLADVRALDQPHLVVAGGAIVAREPAAFATTSVGRAGR